MGREMTATVLTRLPLNTKLQQQTPKDNPFSGRGIQVRREAAADPRQAYEPLPPRLRISP